MLKIIQERLRQKKRTSTYPKTEIVLPETFRRRPLINHELCTNDCQKCQEVCPTNALVKVEGKPCFDLSRCIFCTECKNTCPKEAISFTSDFRLSTSTKDDLLMKGNELKLATALQEKTLKLFGRSLKLREVSAGGCNACEADTNVLNTLFFDLGRFGIQFVASPRHADGLFITGPVTKNMEKALLKTYEAIPYPKIVIAAGACAISGGIYESSPERRGIPASIPVDLYIPGCPPHPMTILDGLLRMLNKLPQDKK